MFSHGFPPVTGIKAFADWVNRDEILRGFQHYRCRSLWRFLQISRTLRWLSWYAALVLWIVMHRDRGVWGWHPASVGVDSALSLHKCSLLLWPPTVPKNFAVWGMGQLARNPIRRIGCRLDVILYYRTSWPRSLGLPGSAPLFGSWEGARTCTVWEPLTRVGDAATLRSVLRECG